MTSKQEQHETDTTVEALRKREQQVRKAIDRGYFSSTAEGQQLTRNVFIGYSKAVGDHIVHQILSSCILDWSQSRQLIRHHYKLLQGALNTNYKDSITQGSNNQYRRI